MLGSVSTNRHVCSKKYDPIEGGPGTEQSLPDGRRHTRGGKPT